MVKWLVHTIYSYSKERPCTSITNCAKIELGLMVTISFILKSYILYWNNITMLSWKYYDTVYWFYSITLCECTGLWGIHIGGFQSPVGIIVINVTNGKGNKYYSTGRDPIAWQQRTEANQQSEAGSKGCLLATRTADAPRATHAQCNSRCPLASIPVTSFSVAVTV